MRYSRWPAYVDDNIAGYWADAFMSGGLAAIGRWLHFTRPTANRENG